MTNQIALVTFAVLCALVGSPDGLGQEKTAKDTQESAIQIKIPKDWSDELKKEFRSLIDKLQPGNTQSVTFCRSLFGARQWVTKDSSVGKIERANS